MFGKSQMPTEPDKAWVLNSEEARNLIRRIYANEDLMKERLELLRRKIEKEADAIVERSQALRDVLFDELAKVAGAPEQVGRGGLALDTTYLETTGVGFLRVDETVNRDPQLSKKDPKNRLAEVNAKFGPLMGDVMSEAIDALSSGDTDVEKAAERVQRAERILVAGMSHPKLMLEIISRDIKSLDELEEKLRNLGVHPDDKNSSDGDDEIKKS